MRRRRIAQIIEATTGGTRRHLMDLVLGLDAERYDVHVICATQRDPEFLGDVAVLRARSIPVHVVPMVRTVAPGSDFLAGARITDLLRRYPCDLVHTHSSKAGFLGRLAARRAGVGAVIHTPHVFPFEMRINCVARALYRKIERWLARRTDSLVCVSRAGMLSAVRAGVAPLKKYAIIHNGIDIADLERSGPVRSEHRKMLAIPDGAPLVGAAGRLAPQKNFSLLIAALRMVREEIPDARLVIFGAGAERAGLERQILTSGLADRVILPGYRRDVFEFYKLFDVFAMSSAWEGLPYSLLEAMASCRPVVATAVGGVPEVIRSGRNGVLTPPGRADAMASALTEVLRAPESARRRLGIQARSTVEHDFNKQVMLKDLQDLYAEILGDQ